MCCYSKSIFLFLITAILAFAIGIGTVRVWRNFTLDNKDFIQATETGQPIQPKVENPVMFRETLDPCDEIKSRSGGKASNKIDVRVFVLNGKSCFVETAYPEEAIRKNVSGQVQVKVQVDGYGIVRSAKVVSGNEMLTQSAVESAYKTRVVPIYLRGEPVNIEGIFIYDFILSR